MRVLHYVQYKRQHRYRDLITLRRRTLVELRHYILEAINDLLSDGADDEGRTLVRGEAQQLVEHLDAKWTEEQRQQILALLRAERDPSAYPAEIVSEAETLQGWFKAMRATATKRLAEGDQLPELYDSPLVNPAFLVTAAGPLCGSVGWYLEYQWLFWVGVGLSGLTLFMNLASGVLKPGALVLPTLPLLFIIFGAWTLSPWYVGAGSGLLVWTGIELIGEIVGRAMKKVS